MALLIVFFVVLVLPIGVSTWILIKNQGPKAKALKDLIKEIASNFKDLFSNIFKLYSSIQEFIQELNNQSDDSDELIINKDEQDNFVKEVTESAPLEGISSVKEEEAVEKEESTEEPILEKDPLGGNDFVDPQEQDEMIDKKDL